MHIANKETGAILSDGEFFMLFPSTSFSYPLTDEILEPFGHVMAHPGTPPTVSSTQYYDMDYATFEDGRWVVKYKVIDRTPEELAQMDETRRAAMVVTPFQGRMALLNAGLLDDVQVVVDDAATDQSVKIAWEYATEWRRLSPMVISLGSALSLTDAQLDDLFAAAAQITA